MENSNKKLIKHYYNILNPDFGKDYFYEVCLYSGNYIEGKKKFSEVNSKEKEMINIQMEKIKKLSQKRIESQNFSGDDCNSYENWFYLEVTESSTCYWEFFLFSDKIEVFEIDFVVFETLGGIDQSELIDKEVKKMQENAVVIQGCVGKNNQLFIF